MLKIVDSRREKRKYTEAVETFFRLCRINETLYDGTAESCTFLKLLTAIESGELFKDEPAKKIIVCKHFLGGTALPEIAKKLDISVSHAYNLRRDIIKDFAMLIFEVIML